MKNFILSYLNNSLSAKEKLLSAPGTIAAVEAAAAMIISAYRIGNKVLVAGNGGSAADAQHMAGELVSRFFFDRPPLSAIALTTDTSIITAIGNDYGYEEVFSRQLRANGQDGDIFIAISTSGNSLSIIKALYAAKEKGIVSVGFTGENSCQMDELCDCIIKVPSVCTPHIQEMHITLIHILCALVEATLFQRESP